MSDKKYNHYIPKFYLSNFSGSNKFIDKYVLSSGKIIRYAPTRSTGGKDYLYGKDGQIENIFCQLEGQWSRILKEIILTENLPRNPNDYEYLLHYIILSENRTLIKANNNMSYWGEQYRVIAKLLKEHGKINMSEDAINSIEAKAAIPNLPDIKNSIYIMNICADLQMSLIKNNSSLPFITSDHPVVKYNQFFLSQSYLRAYGYGQIGIQMFFPISPKYCLVLFDPTPYRLHNYYNNKFIISDPTGIRSINTLIANYAYQELYFSSSTSDQTLRKIVSRRIPNSLSPASGSCRVGDGFLVFTSDPSFLHRVNIPLFSITKPFREITLASFLSPPLRPHVENIAEKAADHQRSS